MGRKENNKINTKDIKKKNTSGNSEKMSKIPWEKIQRRTSLKKFYLQCDCKLSSTEERQKLCKTNFVKSQSHYFSHKKSMYRE